MNRDVKIQVRVNDTELKELTSKAKKEGLTLSSYVRMILFNYYKLMEKKRS
jgi:predicted DNA binding CopG/RHH family protein